MTADVRLTDALHRLPHGAEFRFVDRLTALDPGQSGAGEYAIRGDEPFLRGHFPGDPLFPGVLLVEALAQLAGVIAQADPSQAPLPGLKLTAIRNAKILGTGRPGDVLQLEAEITGRLANLVQARGAVRVHNQTVLQADVVLSGGAEN
ncbi:MAG: beta-hydroxyacyl-ACP dehydratase [Verrucomicrobia bacterium]|jgi:3-hydroxymyristoyl/3-hydroxydecanoyl-(acyl carrier protein) dehydratase|nr:beta-hydroxyacyl-ACP dehydratase [Verrucomicrobiota bacterium]